MHVYRQRIMTMVTYTYHYLATHLPRRIHARVYVACKGIIFITGKPGGGLAARRIARAGIRRLASYRRLTHIAACPSPTPLARATSQVCIASRKRSQRTIRTLKDGASATRLGACRAAETSGTVAGGAVHRTVVIAAGDHVANAVGVAKHDGPPRLCIVMEACSKLLPGRLGHHGTCQAPGSSVRHVWGHVIALRRVSINFRSC